MGAGTMEVRALHGADPRGQRLLHAVGGRERIRVSAALLRFHGTALGVEQLMAEEVWLRGPVAGYAMEVQPVVHALVQAREDLHEQLRDVETERLWRAPGSAAAAAWHVRHLAGSLDRLLTYARGEILSDAQVATLKSERTPDPQLGAAQLLDIATKQIDKALDQVRNTPVASLS